MSKPLVAVVGCGPSGLLAAHACRMRNVPVVVFAPKAKSRLGGAQFSHIPITPYHDEFNQAMQLEYIVRGDPDTYKKKVYGSVQVPFVSFGNVTDGMKVPAWSLTKLYDDLWEDYSSLVVDYKIDPERLGKLTDTFDLVLSSAPAPSMCLGSIDQSIGHFFRSAPVKILNEALDFNLPDNTIVYDGTDEHSYYRMSKIFGVGSTEWGAHVGVPPVGDLHTVNKPIATNCDCHMSVDLDGAGIPKGVIRIGRFGTWTKGELTFHAYNTVIEILHRWGIE
jgi:threonine dehydrogenase-like Zn-dependent dehydrogenase